jgi:hypothetical protein
MATFEFSDDFDATAWYTMQMMEGKQFANHDDPYGWDEAAEYPF